MKLYLIAGEASGDSRGAELMAGLEMRASENVEFFGAGGPQMRSLASAIQDWSGEAVVGLWDVLKKYGYFKRQFDAMLREIDEIKPDAVILIDYPGFNLRIAKALKNSKTRDPKLRVIYYISPQVWAWNRGRIPEMARTLDLMLCIFPFEKALYEKSGLKTTFVGHPMLDTLATKRIVAEGGASVRDEQLVGLFPGSRSKEITRIFPVMIATARQMLRADKLLRFESAAASESLAVMMREMVGDAPITVRQGGSHELMQRAGVGMVASGTATVEAAYFGLPFVILYRVAPLTWEVGKRLVRVPFLGMVNILAEREVVREFLQRDAEPMVVADELLSLINIPEKRAAMVEDLQKVIAGLGEGGASLRAAEAILAELEEGRH